MRNTRALVRFGAATAGWALLPALVLAGCNGGSDGQSSGSLLPADVRAIVFLQRQPRDSGGNVFDYNSYVGGGSIMKLEPPSPTGKLTNLTADPMFAKADFTSWDLSFDATQIAFSARLTEDDKYQLFTMNVDGTNVKQLTAGDHDYVFPTFLPGQKLMFMTNESVEEGSPQFMDEYERATTSQVGTINLDGTEMLLGPRNVSHRVASSLLPDGHVLYTEWRHLGETNDGHLRMMNADMTGMKEAYGSETSATRAPVQANSYLRGRYVSTYQTAADKTAYQVVAVGTSRDRTLQAGKLMLINLDQSEALSSAVDLTPDVPADRGAAMDGVGRFYDAEPIGDPAARKFLVSWSGGPVDTETLAMAKLQANFGLYVYDASDPKKGFKQPLFDNPAFWEIQARPLKTRLEPPITASPIQGESFVVSAINVNNTSLNDIRQGLQSQQGVKVRLIEGFSGEEGIRTFGTTEFDGASLYGEVDVQPDGSFSARVPANVPVHMQVIDKFALSLANEGIWVSGRAGEQRTCGGCHESRSESTPIQPGLTMAGSKPPVDLDVPRAQRISNDFSYGKVRGVPWDEAIQPMLTAKCATCHDGDINKPGNPSFTVVDMTTMTQQTFVFDLSGKKLDIMVGEKMTGAYTASYISLFGLGEILGEDNVQITGTPFDFAKAANAAGSKVITKLNPPQQFPSYDASVRRVPGGAVHPTDLGGQELTAAEYYLLGLSIDMGGQFFSRENRDKAMGY